MPDNDIDFSRYALASPVRTQNLVIDYIQIMFDQLRRKVTQVTYSSDQPSEELA